jgi:hypothetical protein
MKTVLHDVAIVHAPGARYLLCILTANQRSDAAGNAFCRRVSRIVWEAVNRSGSRDPLTGAARAPVNAS